MSRMRALARRLDRTGAGPALRGLARPVVGAVRRRRVDRVAQELLSSGLFDAGYYAAEAGVDFPSAAVAARHYVRRRAERRWSPHPLIAFAAIPAAVRDTWVKGGVAAMLAYFRSARASQRQWSPVFDPTQLPAGGKGAALAFIASLRDDTVLPTSPRLGGTEVTWSQARSRAIRTAQGIRAQVPEVRRLNQLKPTGDAPHTGWVELGRDLVDWEAVSRSLPERVAGRVSIVIPAYRDFRMTLDAVRFITEHTADHDIEVIVVDNGSSGPVSQALAQAVGCFPRTEVVRLPINYNFALGSNVGAARSTGEFILFLNNDTAVREGWLEPLLERLEDDAIRGVQPLLLYPDETIQCAGIEFLAADFLPAVPLAGHPAEDARAVAGVPFSAVTAAALLMRASEVVALRGFDPIFVNGSEDIDLCLRATERFGGSFAVVPRSVVEHRESRTPGRGLRIPENRRIFLERWRGRLPAPGSATLAALGLEVAHLRPAGGVHPVALPVVVRPRQAGMDATGREVPRLRWSIKNPAPGGWYGQRWGDTHFIEDLGQALEAQGQEVVSFRRNAQLSPATALDDVNLAIRGMFQGSSRKSGASVVAWAVMG
ncbi:MAG: glycosyltransferase, partial [Propionicimonas sp.]|nr:glycosyltransferase [Propionicimonas sp.]